MSVTVAVDANGAALGPAEVAAGAAIAASQGVRVVLFGPAEAFGEFPDGIEVVDAPVSIAKAPDPVRASRATPEASIVQATRAVAAGDADAFVSGGSTGPALAAGLFNIKRASGIHRPALAIPVPVPGDPVTIVDVGANVEVRPEHLVQFGFMGAALAQTVLGVERPRVGLLSIGEEASKGTPLVVEAHAALRDRMAEGGTFDFIGNVEGNDPESAGGAYLLGLRRLGVVPHGRFSRVGIAQAILLAARAVEGDVVGRTHAALDAASALRVTPLSGSPSTVASP